jgi:nucleotide-binding universal stress UspA family protein
MREHISVEASMYKAIVVGTDGSPTAQAALSKAVELAKSSGAKLHVVTGFKPAMASSAIAALNVEAMAAGGTELLREAESAVADQVEGMLNDIAETVKADGVVVKTHGLGGDPAEMIIEVAERENADLIVIGNRGMSGAKRFILGSVPNKISHHSPCDVLIVRTA